MQVRAEAPHIKVTVEGTQVPHRLMQAIKAEFTPEQIRVYEVHQDTVDFRETEWYRETKARITPGDVIRIYRENRGWSRAKFGRLVGGFKRRHISAIEKGRRSVSIETARKLAEVLDINVHRILDPTRIE